MEESRSYEVKAWSLLPVEALDYVLHILRVEGLRIWKHWKRNSKLSYKFQGMIKVGLRLGVKDVG